MEEIKNKERNRLEIKREFLEAKMTDKIEKQKNWIYRKF